MSLLEKVVQSVCGQLYYPVEHVAWAADNQLIPPNSGPVWTIAVLLWGIPLLLTLLRKLTQLIQLYQQPKPSNPNTVTTVGSIKHLSVEVVQVFCDLVLAIFWLPSGFLWGGKLSAAVWGTVGTISSIAGLYKTITGR